MLRRNVVHVCTRIVKVVSTNSIVIISSKDRDARLYHNPYAGDGTLHTDMHLIYVDEVCGLFKLVGIAKDVVSLGPLQHL